MAAAPRAARRAFPIATRRAGQPRTGTFGSLRTVRAPNGRLQIIAEVYGIAETGPFLTAHLRKGILTIRAMAHCGTVRTRTWKKVRLTKLLTAAEEARLTRIVLPRFPRPLVIQR